MLYIYQQLVQKWNIKLIKIIINNFIHVSSLIIRNGSYRFCDQKKKKQLLPKMKMPYNYDTLQY